MAWRASRGSARRHGHVLCLLVGIPHVVFDNGYGRVGSVSDTWTRNLALVSPADSPESAQALARPFLGVQAP